ncbi:MFS transporter [Goodfellowiella coeruleoviolacea]|uniref:Drug resistance transporter, EmrB/QacA subfamily n=1 Tax=Goodfellowiella coeruleoviolacea TaxID=334858 RepID=A0AAE3GCL4_9PSEU|nr:MFS transporter [Goodfellowiella coeruleoviolacea]MCP2164934.1 drug resistance transporter, EmrB/QacA subfamily [Goodfellowiella coeruleoviolacea]
MPDVRGRGRTALVLLCTAVFLDSMDLSLMGVALPAIGRELSLTEGTLQWLVSGYAVTYGGFLLLGGRLADLLGRRRVFVLSLAVFAAASLAGGLLSSGVPLVVTRIVKGLAAALTAPAALSLITTTFTDPAQRGRALGVYSLAGAAGYTGGLVLSGLLTDLSWRLVFFLPVPFALLVVVLTPLVIAPGERAGSGRGFDALGAVTGTGAVLLGVYALAERAWPAGVLAVLLLLAFVLVQRRQANPLVPLAVFRVPSVRSANTAAIAWACATIGWQFAAVLHLQRTLHYDALATGLAIAPMGLAIFLAANLAGKLIARWGLGRTAALGMLLQACGILLFLRVEPTSGYLAVLAPALVVHGIGNGLSFPSLNIAAVSDLPEHQQGLASGLITSAVQVGAGIGVAVLAALLTVPGLTGYRLAFLAASGFSLVGAVVSALGIRPAQRTPRSTPAPAHH